MFDYVIPKATAGGISKEQQEMNNSAGNKLTDRRMAGVLMPVASLPGDEGIGTFGSSAYKFVDILADTGMKVWQILPLNPLGYGNSPYQPFSSYAGDELYIDLGELEKAGYLSGERESCPPAGRIDYESAKRTKEPWLRKAYEAFRTRDWYLPSFREFIGEQWVYPYAVFIALKKQNDMRCWNEWPAEQQNWILDGRYDISHLEHEIGYQLFVQYMFKQQWLALKSYANSKGIFIMGDIPFYVGMDSLDVWSSRDDFLLDEQWRPAFVAGVPPDYFSATGQRWGNPVYNWEHLQENNFDFWIKRLEYSSRLYDIIRIDHFRAFDTYWKIKASCDTAIDGEWLEAPGYELFDEVYSRLPDICIVAEDLGDLRPEVLVLRDHFGLMGMNVVEFSLAESDETREHQLIYTGTHDNQTAEGWYRSLNEGQRAHILRVLRKHYPKREPFANKLVRFVYGSKSKLAIVPAADILGLDDSARLNTPGTLGSPNWEWRLDSFAGLNRKKKWVRELIKESER